VYKIHQGPLSPYHCGTSGVSIFGQSQFLTVRGDHQTAELRSFTLCTLQIESALWNDVGISE
jgi:hypothetical protein